ncbi:MAG: AMP-binding protein, partial [Myxococcales bacterium]|nr:AMP-binding protein [Myxococcales bacterium]
VGVALERSADLVVALWGVMAAGCAFVPLDPRHPARRLSAVVADAGVELLLTDRHNAPVFEDFAGRRLVLDGDDGWQRPPAGGALPAIATGSLAYILYTSGSTGRPKGVEISHGSLIAFLDAMSRRVGLDARDTLAAITTLSFDISLLEIFLPLIHGARLLLLDADTAADPRALARRLEDE